MTPHLVVTFRDMEPSPGLERLVQAWVDRLEAVHPRIERCTVTIERPHRRHRRGQVIRVGIRLAVPGPDVVVSREHPFDGAHDDAYLAVRDAFRAVRRRLRDQVHRLRAETTKTRVGPSHGRVAYLDAEGEWGWIETETHRVYFHRNSILDAEPLVVGDEVRFAEELGDEGPQATSVRRVGDHGHHVLSASPGP